jgi:pentatricopeptide repeat protein
MCSCLLREMAQREVPPILRSCCAAMSACSKGGQWQRAVQSLHEMQEQCITPSIRTYNCTINACQRGGNWQLAITSMIKHKAAEHALKSNRVTYGCGIDALHAVNKHKHAEELYIEMLKRSLTKRHWSVEDRGKLDSHDFTEGMAAAAIVLRGSVVQVTASNGNSSAIEVYKYVPPIDSDLHIITGHGTNDGKQDCVLQPAIVRTVSEATEHTMPCMS